MRRSVRSCSCQVLLTVGQSPDGGHIALWSAYGKRPRPCACRKCRQRGSPPPRDWRVERHRPARLSCRAQIATIKGTSTIARRPHNAPPQRETGPRINDRIRSPEIRLIGADGENVGVVTPARAMAMAAEAGLDLVEISPNAEPPVCKIMDFGKFKYETAEARGRGPQEAEDHRDQGNQVPPRHRYP